MKGRNRDIDVQNKCKNTKGEEWVGWIEEIWTDIYALLVLCIKELTNVNLPYRMGNATQCSVVT